MSDRIDYYFEDAARRGQHYSAEYKQGFQACHDGQPMDSNPYRAGPRNSDKWWRGWNHRHNLGDQERQTLIMPERPSTGRQIVLGVLLVVLCAVLIALGGLR